MSEVQVVPIRGKPRTLERTMMDSGFVDGGSEGRAMGARMIFQKFILLDLSVPSEETRVLGVMTPPLLDQMKLFMEGRVSTVHLALYLQV
jgi:hypothetical protein